MPKHAIQYGETKGPYQQAPCQRMALQVAPQVGRHRIAEIFAVAHHLHPSLLNDALRISCWLNTAAAAIDHALVTTTAAATDHAIVTTTAAATHCRITAICSLIK